MPLRVLKIEGTSHLLNRRYHADRFDVGNGHSAFVFLLFGGSGISQEEYESRRTSRFGGLDAAMTSLARELAFTLVHVTSPADGIYNRLSEPDEAARWTRHVDSELLAGLESMPLYAAGHSGGAALAFAGPQALDRCFGAGALGADALPDFFERGQSWSEPAALYYNRGDRVRNANRAAIRSLQEADLIACFVQQPGSHSLADYASNESFGGLVRRAARLCASRP